MRRQGLDRPIVLPLFSACAHTALTVLVTLVFTVLVVLFGVSSSWAEVPLEDDLLARYGAWELSGTASTEEVLDRVREQVADLAPAPVLLVQRREGTPWLVAYAERREDLTAVAAALRETGSSGTRLELGTRWALEVEKSRAAAHHLQLAARRAPVDPFADLARQGAARDLRIGFHSRLDPPDQPLVEVPPAGPHAPQGTLWDPRC